MNNIPKTLFVRVYDKNGRIEGHCEGFPESRTRIPRMEVTAKAEAGIVEKLRQMSEKMGATFTMKDGSSCDIEIAAETDTYPDVRSSVSTIVFAKA